MQVQFVWHASHLHIDSREKDAGLVLEKELDVPSTQNMSNEKVMELFGAFTSGQICDTSLAAIFDTTLSAGRSSL